MDDEKKRRKPSEAILKILFGKSGNVCAFPDCRTHLIADVADASKPLGQIAHIIAAEDIGPRGDPDITPEERNSASNYILLCPTHHSLIDKFPCQYNVSVLREMKRLHESCYEPKETGNVFPVPLKTETLYSSSLPISRIPKFVFSGDTKYRKDNALELFDALNTEEHRDVVYAFELKDKRLYTFWDLSYSDNPFKGVYESDTVHRQKAIDMWADPDLGRLYVSLLNRALAGFLRRRAIGYDSEHYRYYFRPLHKGIVERKYYFKSLAGKMTQRTVVRQPVTKMTGLPKKYWVHDASNLRFQYVGDREWLLTIRPERHLSKDGYEPYTHRSLGSKVTRIKSTMYNWNYLQELQLWREFITAAGPRAIIHFGKQVISIENRLLDADIKWPGIPQDERDFIAQTHEEDLFTFAEQSEIDAAAEGEEFDICSEADMPLEDEL
jgi:hypothetical protein